jgi:hypothetical protein
MQDAAYDITVRKPFSQFRVGGHWSVEVSLGMVSLRGLLRNSLGDVRRAAPSAHPVVPSAAGARPGTASRGLPPRAERGLQGGFASPQPSNGNVGVNRVLTQFTRKVDCDH